MLDDIVVAAEDEDEDVAWVVVGGDVVVCPSVRTSEGNATQYEY